MTRQLSLFLAIMVGTLVAASLLVDDAAAQPAGTMCNVSDDNNNVDNGAIFASQVQQVTDLTVATCNVGLGAQTSYDGTGFVAADTLLIINNVNNNDNGFTAGISVASGANVTSFTQNGSPYTAGTQIPLTTADAFSGTFQFDFGGNRFEFTLVKAAGSNEVQGVTIAA